MTKLQRFYLPGVKSHEGQQYLTRGKNSKHNYFMCGEFNPNVKAGNLIQWFDDAEVKRLSKLVNLSVLEVEIKYDDPIQELKRRIIEDHRTAQREDDVCERGLMVALYEIDHLNQPWSGSDPDET